jgi:hypothetical protein
MLKFLAILLLTISLQAQALRPSFDTKQIITKTVLEWQQLTFPSLPRKQPVVYINYSPLLPNILGLTRQLEPGIYSVDLNPLYPQKDLESTMVHELIHVMQIYSGRLQILQGEVKWEGKTWSLSTPYQQRPWEQEAYLMTAILFTETLPRELSETQIPGTINLK